MVTQVLGHTTATRSYAPQSEKSLAPEQAPADSVELGRDLGVHLMAGAPTGYLSPQIPPPTTYVVPVGIEFAPGLGISLDGKAILVGHKNSAEKFDIIGHLDDGTYPQRDFKVSRDGQHTEIKAKYEWQHYNLNHHDGTTDVKGETDRESFSVKESATALQTVGAFPAKTFTVKPGAGSVQVEPGYAEGPHYTLTQKGNKTIVDAGNEDVNFEFTRNDDGSFAVHGKLKPQDFTITPQEGGWLVKGYYPQQKYIIKAG